MKTTTDEIEKLIQKMDIMLEMLKKLTSNEKEDEAQWRF